MLVGESRLSLVGEAGGNGDCVAERLPALDGVVVLGEEKEKMYRKYRLAIKSEKILYQ